VDVSNFKFVYVTTFHNKICLRIIFYLFVSSSLRRLNSIWRFYFILSKYGFMFHISYCRWSCTVVENPFVIVRFWARGPRCWVFKNVFLAYCFKSFPKGTWSHMMNLPYLTNPLCIMTTLWNVFKGPTMQQINLKAFVAKLNFRRHFSNEILFD